MPLTGFEYQLSEAYPLMRFCSPVWLPFMESMCKMHGFLYNSPISSSAEEIILGAMTAVIK